MSSLWHLGWWICFAAVTVDWLVLDLAAAPDLFRRLPELLVALFAVCWLAVTRQDAPIRLPAFFGWLLAAVAFGSLGALLEGGEVGRAGVAVRNMLRFALVGALLANSAVDVRVVRDLLARLGLLLVVQVPIAVYQWWVIGKTDDEVFGMVRSTGSLGLLMLVLVVMTMGYFVHVRRRSLLLLVIPLAALPPVIGEVKIFFIVLPVILALVYLDTVASRPIMATLGLVVGVLTFWYALSAFALVPGQEDLRAYLAQKLTEPFTEVDQGIDISQQGRILELRQASLLSLENGGMGRGLGARTVFAAEVSDDRFATKTLATTTAGARLEELGVWGFCCYLMAFLTPGWCAWRWSKTASEPTDRMLAFTTAHTSVIFALLVFYTNVEVPPVSTPFWLLVGLATARRWSRAR